MREQSAKQIKSDKKRRRGVQNEIAESLFTTGTRWIDTPAWEAPLPGGMRCALTTRGDAFSSASSYGPPASLFSLTLFFSWRRTVKLGAEAVRLNHLLSPHFQLNEGGSGRKDGGGGILKPIDLFFSSAQSVLLATIHSWLLFLERNSFLCQRKNGRLTEWVDSLSPPIYHMSYTVYTYTSIASF